MFPAHFDEIETIEQVHVLSKEERIEYSRYVSEFQKTFDWNSYNTSKHNNTLDQFEDFKKFPPTPKDEDKKFRSWYEYFMFNCTCLSRLEFEPKSAKIDYVVHKTYQTDASIPRFEDLLIELKGYPRSRDELMKHIFIREQTRKDTFFILNHRNIELQWLKPKKDGTRSTLENWLDANGFDWCYFDQVDEVFKSNKFKQKLMSL